MDYKAKALEIARHLGFDIVIEGGSAYTVTDDQKTELVSSSNWRKVYRELIKWGDGCNLVSPISGLNKH